MSMQFKDAQPNQEFYCPICKVPIFGQENYTIHLKGKQHLKNTLSTPDVVPKIDSAPARLASPSSNVYKTCSKCKDLYLGKNILIAKVT
uniref:Zinc finger double-stranded RNA binding domain-containing protein n=1 Tax=Acrobeloides nanus TaxID=290746 RepID=A0A914CQ36_9BILA